MARSFQNQGRSRGSFPARRKRSWEVGPGSGTGLLNTTASGSLILGSGSQTTSDDLTVARIRGQFSYWINQAAATGDGYVGAFGIGKVEANAFAVGVTAVPTPVTDPEWDGWMFWHPISAIATVDAETLSITGRVGAQWVPVDTKAMRKMDLGDVIYAVVEVTEVAGASTLVMAMDSRMLVLIP